MSNTPKQLWAQRFGTEHAGKMVVFQEPGDTYQMERKGRVVGFYLNLAEVVIEVEFEPKYPIDYTLPYLTGTFAPDRGIMTPKSVSTFLSQPAYRKYILVPVNEVKLDTSAKDPRFPGVCTRCKAPAFVTFQFVECSNRACYCFKP